MEVLFYIFNMFAAIALARHYSNIEANNQDNNVEKDMNT